MHNITYVFSGYYKGIILKEIIIKRYKNHRLYNTYEQKFISFVELKKIIQDGYNVIIQDHETQKDITTDILLQVAHEDLAEVLSANFLLNFIRNNKELEPEVILSNFDH